MKKHKDSLGIEELIPGNYYYMTNGITHKDFKWVIFKYQSICDTNLRINTYADISNDWNERHGGKEYQNISYWSMSGRPVRIATPDEKAWLIACIEAGRYIPKEELNNTYLTYP